MRLHDVGRDRPKVPHEGWVAWMLRCAAAWAGAGHEVQAATVRASLERNRDPARCEVCTWKAAP